MRAHWRTPRPDTTRKPATHLYLAIARALDSRIRSLRWTMQECDDRAGLQDGFTAKLLHPDSPNGRQSQWPTVQLLVDALFPGGVDVILRPRSVHASACMENRRTPERSTMRIPTPAEASEMARKRWANLSPEERSAAASHAAKARWQRPAQTA